MLSDGLCGFIGVITGAILTIFSQYLWEIYREKRKNKKVFIKHHYQIYEDLFILKGALKQMQSFLTMDLTNYSNDDLESELYPSIINFSIKCSNIWIKFRDILLGYFHKSINQKSFLILDHVVLNIINMDTGLKNIDFDIFRNLHNNMKNSKSDVDQAITLVNLIEDEFYKMRNKYIKRMI
jgi:hypothetical protein